MTNPPQSITARYISNLLHDGQNKDFVLDSLQAISNLVEEVKVGHYYKAILMHLKDTQIGIGATPAQAVQRSLEKFGVTFR